MKKTKKFIITFIRTFVIVVLIFVICISGIIAGSLYGYIETTDEVDINNLSMKFTTFVYYIDKSTQQPVELERLYKDENRIWVPLMEMPKYLRDATVAIEDERFYKHKGFDLKRIAGAAIQLVTTGKAGYGASTITQQLIKNITNEQDVSMKRKIQEIYRAYRLEKRKTKNEILELYLNTFFLGENCNGVQAAANTYFGKDAKDLTLAESACIVGITQFPVLYNPLINPDKNKERQEVVLKKMNSLGYISDYEYYQAVTEELVFKDRSSDQQSASGQSYFVDAVMDEVLNDLQKNGMSESMANNMLSNQGLRIYATIDMDIQRIMDEFYSDSKNFPKTSSKETPQSAMVVLDPNKGDVLGIVGGRGEKSASRVLNRATHSLRQPGSAIKPVAVYAPAIEYGLVTPASSLVDEPMTINGWSPKNSYAGFKGRTTVRHALEQSMNIPAIKTLQKVTIDKSYDFLVNRLGVTSLVSGERRTDGKTDKTLSGLSLGGLTDGVSVLEMAGAYQPFVNRGIYIQPHTYTKVLDHNGNTILEKGKTQQVAMSEKTAFLMNNMLRGVVSNGTGRGAAIKNGIATGGKTGTTDEDRDRWFIGFSPYYVAGVWFGYDQPSSLRELSGNPCIPIFKSVMDRIHEGKAVISFTQPKGMLTATICTASGKLATAACSHTADGDLARTEYFATGTSPADYCDIHSSVRICTVTGLLAGENCPPGVVVDRRSAGDGEAFPTSVCQHEGLSNLPQNNNQGYTNSNSDIIATMPPTDTPIPINRPGENTVNQPSDDDEDEEEEGSESTPAPITN